jgi:hypothetical protein
MRPIEDRIDDLKTSLSHDEKPFKVISVERTTDGLLVTVEDDERPVDAFIGMWREASWMYGMRVREYRHHLAKKLFIVTFESSSKQSADWEDELRKIARAMFDGNLQYAWHHLKWHIEQDLSSSEAAVLQAQFDQGPELNCWFCDVPATDKFMGRFRLYGTCGNSEHKAIPSFARQVEDQLKAKGWVDVNYSASEKAPELAGFYASHPSQEGVTLQVLSRDWQVTRFADFSNRIIGDSRIPIYIANLNI